MDELIKINNEYDQYIDAFDGEDTDWVAQHKTISALTRRLENLHFKYSKNSIFYDRIRRWMIAEYNHEEMRVYKKVLICK